MKNLRNKGLEDYYINKHLMKSGDLLEFAPDSTLGKIIRFKTKKDVSHTALIVEFPYEELKDTRHVLEVLEVGTCVNELELRLSEYKGSVYWSSLKAEYNSYRTSIVIWALLHTCKEFPHRSLFRSIFSEQIADYEKFMCNEYYFFNLKDNKLITGNKAPYPGDFYKFNIHEKRIQIV